MLSIVTGATTAVLREKTKKVTDPLAPETQTLLSQMVATMRKAEGIGLAAPQIGRSLRLCVTEIDGVVRYFINPTITARSRTKVIFEEGCLSLPGKFFPIERSESITVRYTDETGRERKEKPRGLLAICLQHELDHLDGVLIVDRHAHQRGKKNIYVPVPEPN